MMKLKRLEILILALVFLLCSSALGAWFVASEKITVSTTIKTLTAATYTRATSALVKVETASIYWSCDPTTFAADSTTGFTAVPMEQIPLTSQDMIRNFRAVRSGGSDATIKAQYFQ